LLDPPFCRKNTWPRPAIERTRPVLCSLRARNRPSKDSTAQVMLVSGVRSNRDFQEIDTFWSSRTWCMSYRRKHSMTLLYQSGRVRLLLWNTECHNWGMSRMQARWTACLRWVHIGQGTQPSLADKKSFQGTPSWPCQVILCAGKKWCTRSLA